MPALRQRLPEQPRALNLKYVQHVACTRKLTIGSIKASTVRGVGGYDDGNTYMCHETGIGSGSVYHERDLFRTEEEAQFALDAQLFGVAVR